MNIRYDESPRGTRERSLAHKLMNESSNGMVAYIMNEKPDLVRKILTRPEDWRT